MSEPDSRIRANTIEALWGVDSEDSRKIFLDALNDSSNRVVVNGILGLYLLGEPSVVGSILKMIDRPEVAFRIAGIWLIGELEDLRFLPVLARLMKESAPALRPYVFRAFARLKQKRSRIAALPALQFHALGGKSLAEGWRKISVVPLSAARRAAPWFEGHSFRPFGEQSSGSRIRRPDAN